MKSLVTREQIEWIRSNHKPPPVVQAEFAQTFGCSIGISTIRKHWTNPPKPLVANPFYGLSGADAVRLLQKESDPYPVESTFNNVVGLAQTIQDRILDRLREAHQHITTCPTCGSPASIEEASSQRPGQEPTLFTVIRCLNKRTPCPPVREDRPLPANIPAPPIPAKEPTKMTKQCKHCGHDFVSKTTRTKFCSRKCANKHTSAQRMGGPKPQEPTPQLPEGGTSSLRSLEAARASLRQLPRAVRTQVVDLVNQEEDILAALA